MSDAIAKALPTRICRTGQQVGFARVGKLLRYFTNEAQRFAGATREVAT